MQIRSSFTGTGGELFKKLFGGLLLSLITFGIYLPWFIVGMQKYVYEKTTIHGTTRGDLSLEFTGTGGQLFVKGLVGYLLTMLTIGIYSFWFMVKMAKWQLSNTVIRSEGGAPAMGMGPPGMGVQQIGGPPQPALGGPQPPAYGTPQPQPGGFGGPPPGPPMGGPPQGYA